MKINKRKSIYLSVFFLLLFIGCSSDNSTNEMDKKDLLPPSLQQEKSKIQIVTLNEKQARELNIQVQVVKHDNFTYQITAPGIVQPAPEYLYIVSAPIEGRVATINFHEGDPIKKGDVLIELESLEYANLLAEYLQAIAEEDYQKSQLERLTVLVEKRISPQRSLDRAQSDFSRSQTSRRAARSRLLAIGVSEKQVLALQKGESDVAKLKIYSPLDGIITGHEIDLGQSVIAYQKMLTIINPEKMMIRGFLSPEDGLSVKPGDKMWVSMKNFPERTIETTVQSVNPSLDEMNRSISINTIVKTKNGWPVPGQNARLIIDVITDEPVISIPLQAVEYEGESATVFVKTEKNSFEKRSIIIKRIAGQNVIISSGLKGGEEVAVTQVFSLKALSKFEEFGEE